MLLRERGAPNERLGTALVADGARLFVSAPGATQGQGAVRTYECRLFGHIVLHLLLLEVLKGPRNGHRLSVCIH